MPMANESENAQKEHRADDEPRIGQLFQRRLRDDPIEQSG
jgi:hypothetical protein